MTYQEKALLQTLAYSDIFRFPLTKDELWQFLISEKTIEKDVFETGLKNLVAKKLIVTKKGFYALADHAADIATRIDSTQELQKKVRLAKRAAYYLSYIPTISLIGISGGVAIGKADKADDIDLFIITKKNTLFMTRLWIQTILEILRQRRKRLEQHVGDTICVNLLIDETKVSWPSDARDIYTAHEIIQMQPLFERNRMYQQFISSNKWVRKFLPNAYEEKPQITGNSWRRRYITLNVMSAIINFWPFEKVAGMLQKYYMKRHRTTETISDRMLAFHPIDYRSKTLVGLSAKLQQLGLLTNN